MVHKTKYMFFRKSSIIAMTPSHIMILNKKTKEIKKKDLIKSLAGFTQSLIVDAENFIMHFSTRSDEEFTCKQ